MVYYTDSPIIAKDDEAAPAYTVGGFTPSTVPGCRAPHFWLPDGRSLYDAFAQGYTLMRFDTSVDVGPLQAAAQAQRVPLTVVDLEGIAIPDAYRHKLVLCRDDQNIAWRGNAVPVDAAALVELLRGVRTDKRHPACACLACTHRRPKELP